MRPLVVALLLLAPLLGCGDGGPDFLAPGPGDFVQDVEPDNGEVVTTDKLVGGAVSLVLDFTTAEGSFGFGSIRSFSFDGDDVRDELELFPSGGPPASRVIVNFRLDEVTPGQHTVEVVYADSRGTLHRLRWSFTVED